MIPDYSVLGLFLKKPIRGIAVGSGRQWLRKHDDFSEYGVDIISMVSVPFSSLIIHLSLSSKVSAWPAKFSLWVADPVVIKVMSIPGSHGTLVSYIDNA